MCAPIQRKGMPVNLAPASWSARMTSWSPDKSGPAAGANARELAGSFTVRMNAEISDPAPGARLMSVHRSIAVRFIHFALFILILCWAPPSRAGSAAGVVKASFTVSRPTKTSTTIYLPCVVRMGSRDATTLDITLHPLYFLGPSDDLSSGPQVSAGESTICAAWKLPMILAP